MQVLVAGQFYREVFQFSRLHGLFPERIRGRLSLSLSLFLVISDLFIFILKNTREDELKLVFSETIHFTNDVSNRQTRYHIRFRSIEDTIFCLIENNYPLKRYLFTYFRKFVP